MSYALRFGARWIILCAAAVPAAGQVLPDAIQACKSESDDARRLQCYDREVAKFPLTSEQSFGLSQSQVAAAQNQLKAAQNQSSGPAPREAPREKILTVKVVALRDRPHMGFIVTFDNGQVWAQYEDESIRGIHVGDAATIKPGMLGSFWLVGPTGWATKIRRVQ